MVRRLATLDDLDALVAMGQHFLHGTVYQAIIASNPEQMRTLATTLILGTNSEVFVAEQGGELVGMLGMLLYPHYISGEMVAGEVFWWVEPTHRGVGVRLLKDAETWALERGAQIVQMIAPTVEVEVLYDRLGFTPVERTFQKRVG